MTNTPDKSEMKAMTSNRPVSEMVECEPCPFCGAATTLPPNTPYIRHPPNGCYFANHNIRFQNWQKRASSQAPSDDVVERITQSVLQTTWGYPGPSDPVVKSVREGVRAAIAALQAVPAMGEVGELLLHGTLSMTKRQVIVDFADRKRAEAFFEALERVAQASGEE